MPLPSRQELCGCPQVQGQKDPDRHGARMSVTDAMAGQDVRYQQWANARGLKRAKPRWCYKGKACGHCLCAIAKGVHVPVPNADHVRMWCRPGQGRQIVCITSEPYPDSHSREDVDCAAKIQGVRLIRGGESPYWPGVTEMFEWWKESERATQEHQI